MCVLVLYMLVVIPMMQLPDHKKEALRKEAHRDMFDNPAFKETLKTLKSIHGLRREATALNAAGRWRQKHEAAQEASPEVGSSRPPAGCGFKAAVQ